MLFFIFLLFQINSLNLFKTSCGYGSIDLTYLSSPIDYTNFGFTPFKYFTNICGVVNYPSCREKFPMTNICQIGSNNTIHSLGNWNKNEYAIWSYINESHPDTGVKAIYTNGEICNYTNQSYVVEINYKCAIITSSHFVINKESECLYKIEHEVDCHPEPLYPSQGLSDLVLFFIILLSCLLPFLVGMFFYQFKRCRRLINVNWKASCSHMMKDIGDFIRCRKHRIQYMSSDIKNNYQQI